MIQNKAHIFFDYNQPIITNTTQTLITKRTGSVSFPEDKKGLNKVLKMWPNPAQSYINVQLPMGEISFPLSKIDSKGSTLRTYTNQAGDVLQLSLDELPEGIYTVRSSAGASGSILVR